MAELIIPKDFVVSVDGDEKADDSPSMKECVTFENFAMLLNLVNNVYIKNNI